MSACISLFYLGALVFACMAFAERKQIETSWVIYLRCSILMASGATAFWAVSG